MGSEKSGHAKKQEIAPSVFARKAAAYFRECDSGTATAACDTCETEFGDARCGKCGKKQRRPYTLSGLCLALGITKRKFTALKGDQSFADAVEMALLKIEAYIEENQHHGAYSGTLALAILRENFGWGEKTESTDRIEVVMSEEVGSLAK